MPSRRNRPALRIALCDIRDPEVMAEQVLALCWPDGTGPVPVEDIAYQLDIHEIRRAAVSGFEGMLLTDRVRSAGPILVNDAHGHEGRIRFTIAHELGHFLLEHHEFLHERGFSCSSADMRCHSGKKPQNQHARQEAEANRFAGALLAPRSCFAGLLKGRPKISTVQALARKLQISKEAALRRLIDLHPLPMAVVFSRGDVISAAPRHDGFPWLHKIKGHPLPADILDLAMNGSAETAWQPSAPGTWCAPTYGVIWQQVQVSTYGRITILLHRQAA